MTEHQTKYEAGQPRDRLAEIKEALDVIDRGLAPEYQDMAWLVAEVERLTDGLIIRDAYIQAIGADIDKALEIGREAMREAEQLAMLKLAAENTTGGDERSKMLVQGVLDLIEEVERLRTANDELINALARVFIGAGAGHSKDQWQKIIKMSLEAE